MRRRRENRRRNLRIFGWGTIFSILYGLVAAEILTNREATDTISYTFAFVCFGLVSAFGYGMGVRAALHTQQGDSTE